MPPRSIEIAGATVRIFDDAAAACNAAADSIASTIRAAIESQGRAVIGLATGHTPMAVYARLVALHRRGGVSFENVSTFNLDEYYPISPTDPQSYRVYMDRHLFNHVSIRPNHTHLFDGTIPEAFVADHAAEFDRWIVAEGGLDLQLLGIGRNGHIGFNEPSDLPTDRALKLPSRLMHLHPITLEDAALDFGDVSLVPRRALTLGVTPILAARSILVLAFGPKKAEIVAKALRGPITAEVPASLLRSAQGRVTWLIDEAAAVSLG